MDKNLQCKNNNKKSEKDAWVCKNYAINKKAANLKIIQKHRKTPLKKDEIKILLWDKKRSFGGKTYAYFKNSCTSLKRDHCRKIWTKMTIIPKTNAKIGKSI